VTRISQNVRTAADIRRAFIEYFVARQEHAFVPSSPVVPHGDPTLLFTNAGMNQFKDVFLGQGTRAYKRAANSQKCIRAGGKHNDLEDVGRDTYHHTFFEMLGNWSFGDYFKEEAIAWAWELLTSEEWFGIDPSRLHVTVFAGDAEDGLPPDEEAEKIWLKYVPAERISRWARKDNFWEMGETGPCGPCSEIHYDGTPDGSGGALVNRDDPRVIEIWNLVFMQFSRGSNGKLSPLPAKHVDTGMGFERVVRVLQGCESNYDTDIWSGIFGAIQRASGARPYAGKLDDALDTAYRVVADHIRCLTIALTDGAAPSNDGRGYVLRRILRRAVRMVRQNFGVREPMLCELVPAVVESLGDAFPELRSDPGRVARIIADEEESFLRTLDRGMELFAEAAERARGGGNRITADDTFRLHDTYGFPVDLTRVMAEEQGLSVDETGYETLMEEARERSRRTGDVDHRQSLPPEVLAELAVRKVAPTDDHHKYAPRPITARVRGIWNGERLVQSVRTGQTAAVILDRTNHYAESGGQAADHGVIHVNEPLGGERGGDVPGLAPEFRVDDVRAAGGFVLHIGSVHSGEVHVGDGAEVAINQERRAQIAAHHTGTHLLNHALRETLRDAVDQKGSLVAPDRLRFDFSASQGLSPAQLEQVEQRVGEAIAKDWPVYAAPADLERAKAVRGVRAVFGERYPDPVRVVSIGAPVDELLAHPEREIWERHSVEFCGGTHLASTGEAGAFVILSEQALAAGVRRITALTGPAAQAAIVAATNLDRQIDEATTLDDAALAERFGELHAEFENLSLSAGARRALQPRLDALRDRAKKVERMRSAAQRTGVVEQAREIVDRAAGRPVIVEVIEGADKETLLSASDAIRAKRPDDLAFMLFTADPDEGKVTIVASVPKAFIAKGLKAGDWVREAASICGGGGGGRPDMAQAGGKDPAKVPDAVEQCLATATKVLGAEVTG